MSLPVGSTGSFVGVAVVVYDPSSMFFPWNGLNLKAPRDGTYLVSATVQWAANGAGARTLLITKEAGGTVTQVTGLPAEASTPTVQTVSGVVHLEQGKFVTVLVRQTGSGGPLDVSLTTFDMAYVGIRGGALARGVTAGSRSCLKQGGACLDGHGAHPRAERRYTRVG